MMQLASVGPYDELVGVVDRDRLVNHILKEIYAENTDYVFQ